VWYRGGSHIVQKAIAIDKKRTDLAMAEAYNIPQLFVQGMDDEAAAKFKKGRSYLINVSGSMLDDSGNDAKYISPNEALDELNKLIQERYDRLGLQSGLSKSQISGETATSGYHLALSKQDVRELSHRRRKYYKKPITNLCARLIEALSNTVRISQNTENLKVSLKYKEPVMLESTSEREQGWALKFANGTANLIDYEMQHNPEIATREEALAIVLGRAKEAAEIANIRNPYLEDTQNQKDDKA
jgi:coenzyme F420-reducing hydrogenase alpha subunit